MDGLGEIEPEPAPAGADVEHALAGLDRELGREVALLGAAAPPRGPRPRVK